MSPKLQRDKKMYLIVIAWLYVTLLMGLAEAFSTQGTVLGAIITFVLYGLLPMALVVYLMGTPLRRKERLRQAALETARSRPEPDASGHAAGLTEHGAVAPVGKKPD
jgi:hypothetical protein